MPGVGSVHSNGSLRSYDSSSTSRKGKWFQADEGYVPIRPDEPVVPRIKFTHASSLFGPQDEKWNVNVESLKKFEEDIQTASVYEKYACHIKVDAISAVQTAKNEEDINLWNDLVSRALAIIEELNASPLLNTELRKEIYKKWDKLNAEIKDYADLAGTPLEIPKCQLLIGLERLNKSLGYTVGFTISTWGWATTVGLLVVSNIVAVTIPFLISTLAALLKLGTWFWADLAKKEERNAQEIHDDIFNPLIRSLETIIAMFPADGRDSEQKMLLVGQAEQNKKLDSHIDYLKNELAISRAENREIKDKMNEVLALLQESARNK